MNTLLGKYMMIQGGATTALHWAINSVKKGGIVSIAGIYGPIDALIPIGNVVNKGITIRANQASVKRLLPKLMETRPEDFSNSRPADHTKINGWGVDSDPRNDPTYPMKRRTDEEQRGYS